MLTDAIKEHWERGAAVVALAFEATVAFERHLAEVSLETRFVIAGVAVLSVAILIFIGRSLSHKLLASL